MKTLSRVLRTWQVPPIRKKPDSSLPMRLAEKPERKSSGFFDASGGENGGLCLLCKALFNLAILCFRPFATCRNYGAFATQS